MKRTEVEKKVKELISRKIGISQEDILPEKKIEDLCRDSIQIFELIIEFEKELGKKLEYRDICMIETIEDIIDKMEKES